MITARTLVSPLIEMGIASSLRTAIVLNRARKDSSGTLESAKLRGFPVLGVDDINPPASPDRSSEFFILGSGPSVLDLTPENFARMRKGTTIGVNSWVLHDFVPDAYSFEEMENESYREVAAGLSRALRQENVLDAKPSILHLRPRLTTPQDHLVSIPKELENLTRYYGRVAPETRRVSNLSTDLRRLIRSSMSGAMPGHILVDGGFSVARMAFLGIARGFSSIVLVGVDLDADHYFFEAEGSYLSRHNLSQFNPWSSRSTSHDTEETINRNFPASEFLLALARASESLGGPKFSVMSSKSKLAAHLPVMS